MEAADLENLLLRQYDLGQQINQLLANFKKDSSSRKTADYLKKRLTSLGTLWEEFSTNHTSLAPHSQSKSEHPYFTTSYHEQVSQKYETLKNLIADFQAQLQKHSSAVDTKEASGSEPPKTSASLRYELSKQNDIVDSESDNNDISSRLIKRQKATMKTVTHFLQDIEGCNLPNQSNAYYDFKIDLLRKYQTEMCNNHQLINEVGANISSNDYKDEYYHELELWLQTTIITLQEQRDELKQTPKGPISTSNSTPSQIKLPKILLPTFSGNYLNWVQFRELYTQLIHEQPIPDTQKMFYLVSSLSGDARNLIKHLAISNSNYQTAWEILYNRYENKRLLVTAFLNKLLSQQTSQAESSASLKALHDTTKECILGLQNLGIDAQSWDPILVHLLVKKLDKGTHTLYEQSLSDPRELNSMENKLNFLETRFQSLEALGGKTSPTDKVTHNQGCSQRSSTFVASADLQKTCAMCKQHHPLFTCKTFRAKSATDRLQILKKHNLCINCMKPGHAAQDCKSRECTKCTKKHNTLVHIEKKPFHNNCEQESSPKPESITLATQTSENHNKYVLLSTVIVKISSHNGKETECRAILDSGSQLNFITKALAKKLALTQTSETLCIRGIGSSTQQAQHRANITIKSRINAFSENMEVYILPKITEYQPAKTLNITNLAIPNNLNLADPQFYYPGRIDLLIGAENYYQFMSIGQINLGNNLPTLQNTVFGWIVAGPIITNTSSGSAVCGICTEEEVKLEEIMQRFWQLEEVENCTPALTSSERKCEEHFNQTVQRMECGRFMVRLPFMTNPSTLGDSRQIAFNRFRSIERKLKMNLELKTQYSEFMNEYLELGHMEEINPNSISKSHYFLPHHCVLKPDSATSKLRVVFDALAKTSTNLSLNNILHTGPRIQEELLSILLRFRLPRFVFTADIEKMYRQILIHPDDRQFQLILWRNDESQPIKCYQLSTVTYGITTAPYLAIRCLHQLASQVKEHYPLASTSLTRDFYVDDVMSGSDTIREALEKQAQLKEVLKSAGFNLRKWCSNHPALLNNITKENRAMQLDIYDETNPYVKTLGLRWDPRADEFQITTNREENLPKITKRTVLSEIAHLFDPLGIISPVIIIAKLFIQELWNLKLDWDAAIPMELHTRWIQFRQGLSTLNDVKIPRHVFSNQTVQNMQLHTFADASEKAYGAAVYIRSVLKDNTIIVRLLCSKSKVAPLSSTTLARLELCAAKLAAQLTHRIKRDLSWKDPCYYWTDSEIVLAWINSASSSYHTFVANRIAAIQEVTLATQWRHVPSKFNPADLASRGVAPQLLKGCHLWFYGPIFLHGPESSWPTNKPTLNADLEKKQLKATLTCLTTSETNMWGIDHHNSFLHLQRVLTYVRRFIKNCRPKLYHHQQYGSLAVEELDDTLAFIVKGAQNEGFAKDLLNLQKYGQVEPTSSLVTLHPFLDERGIIRVGGRLDEANISYDAKHPMLLPYGHDITRLLITDIHILNKHAGPQAILATLRQRFWAIKAKTTARSIVQKCFRCSKTKPKLLTQIMGNLPALRVQPARPFVHAGVDFCGPFWIHFKMRGKRPVKAYVAIFCCFPTKAVHIEVVSDLTTEAFIGALKRFIGRRGHCKILHCDNATNFLGAKNQLTELQDTIYAERSKQLIINFCASKNIEFRFIPPRAPHFGGLWEAAVKSAKYLFQRGVSTSSLTYEELETVMVEIEAILNSRPLTPMSSDPNDLTALTPGHFLIGEPLTSIVDPLAEQVKGGLLKRWKLVSHLKNEFWRRWTREYLSELQHRYKWNKLEDNIQPGTMVILKEDNIPVLSWPLGRILKVFKGKDSQVRVADIKTANGVLRRPIHKLAPLLIDQNSDQTKPSQHPDQGTSSEAKNESAVLTTTNLTSRDEEGQPERKKQRKINSGIGLFLMTCLVMPLLGSTHIIIEPFTTQPGLYFENMGLTHLTSNEWNLVVFYDMKAYWRELNFVMNMTTKLNQLCQGVIDPQSCNETISQFWLVIQEVQNSNELLLPPSSRRFKRSPLDIVGNIANSLFGVLDSSYADKMSNIIDDLEGNQQHLLQLLQNQTSIIDSTANIMKRVQTTSDTQLKEFNAYMQQATNAINKMQKDLREQRTTEIFNGLALRLILAITNYQRMQAALLDVVIDSHHGKINPLLLSPKQLQIQLNLIKEHLPSTIKLPAAQNNLLELYNLMTIEGRITDTQLIVRLRLPLLSYDTFEMLSVVPVPYLLNGTFITVEPTTKYLIVDLHRELYYPLTLQELSRCSTFGQSGHICKQHHPLYKRNSQTTSCELNILTQSQIKTSCKLSSTTKVQRWTQLINPNHWIYVVKQETPISVLCGKTISQQSLRGSGIVRMSSGCVLKDEVATIQSHNLHTTDVNSFFRPSKNFTDLILPSKLSDLIYKPLTTDTLADDIASLHEKINNIREEEILPTKLR